MTGIKVVMDSGKEYVIETPYSVQQFTESFYDKITNPINKQSTYVMTNQFMYLDDHNKIMFNPQHVSSIEVI